MDELDRMFRRLVQNARAASADYLTRPFEVAEIYHTLLPYRLHRAELGFDSVQQYEGTLMRLLAGERSYLTGDPDMQRAMRDELRSPSPDTSAFRAFAMAPVQFAPDALREMERESLPPRRSGESALASARPTAPAGPSIGAALGDPPPPSRREAAPPPIPAPPAPARPAPPAGVAGASAASTAPTPVPPPRREAAAAASEQCPYCGGRLPDGRAVTFCPHCGQNLTVRHCPACSTELEVGWKFCITCGRNVEELAGAPDGG